MSDEKNIKAYNSFFLERISFFLNECPDLITEEMVKNTAADCSCCETDAYAVLLAGSLDMYDNKTIMNCYIKRSLKKLSAEKYLFDSYYKNVSLSDIKSNEWKITVKSYKPYELFPCGDLKKQPDGRIIPSLGFFDSEYFYPCIMQDGREWMLITPNEIETMKKPVNDAFGDVLTYGLGLGYFAYMASEKFCVKSVTVVEKDKNVIKLFESHILPQFHNKQKIKIINGDAFEYAARHTEKYDYVFADIWHDPTDGVNAYLILKMLERNETKYAYWIEDTIKCYL